MPIFLKRKTTRARTPRATGTVRFTSRINNVRPYSTPRGFYRARCCCYYYFSRTRRNRRALRAERKRTVFLLLLLNHECKFSSRLVRDLLFRFSQETNEKKPAERHWRPRAVRYNRRYQCISAVLSVTTRRPFYSITDNDDTGVFSSTVYLGNGNFQIRPTTYVNEKRRARCSGRRKFLFTDSGHPSRAGAYPNRVRDESK